VLVRSGIDSPSTQEVPQGKLRSARVRPKRVAQLGSVQKARAMRRTGRRLTRIVRLFFSLFNHASTRWSFCYSCFAHLELDRASFGPKDHCDPHGDHTHGLARPGGTPARSIAVRATSLILFSKDRLTCSRQVGHWPETALGEMTARPQRIAENLSTGLASVPSAPATFPPDYPPFWWPALNSSVACLIS
jgi:hypothetical protein